MRNKFSSSTSCQCPSTWNSRKTIFTVIGVALAIYTLTVLQFLLRPTTEQPQSFTSTYNTIDESNVESISSPNRKLNNQSPILVSDYPSTPPPPPPPPPCTLSSPSTPSYANPAAVMQTEELVPSLLPGDSEGTLIHVKGRGEEAGRNDDTSICTFTNVCVTEDRVLLRAQNYTQWKVMNDLISQCFTKNVWYEEPRFCRSCFHPGFLPELLPFEYEMGSDGEAENGNGKRVYPDVFASPFLPYQHMWSVHKWVRHHHIAHWAQKLLIWQSIYQQRPIIDNYLPKLEGIVFHDSDDAMTEHERVLLNVTIRAALDESHPLLAVDEEERSNRFIWAPELAKHKEQQQHLCFPRLSFTPHYGVFSSNPEDVAQFRSLIYSTFHLPPPLRCPPKRIVLIYRSNRRIINQQQVVELVQELSGMPVEVATIDEKSSSEVQIKLFASTGLLLSSHSSQMINVMFSQPGSAMVEIAPEFYNADFGEYAHGMGVFFQYALGGEVGEGAVDQPLHRECVEKLNECDGASYCVLRKRGECRANEYPNKNLNFYANLTAVKIAVKNSLTHLNWLCGGRWNVV